MKKLYEKSEIWFAVGWILVYVLVMGNLQANFGTGSIYSVLGLALIVAGLLAFLLKNGLAEKYGLKKPGEYRRFLFYIPLLLIAGVNLWFGVKLHYGIAGQICAVAAMALSGVAEELIFRGLLFRAMEKDGLKAAVIVSSLTFGAGHIINLLTGAATLETLLQVLYAAAIGFAFVAVFYKSGSILPCIITHSLVNITAEFSCEGPEMLVYLQVVFIIAAAGGYALYLYKLKPGK